MEGKHILKDLFYVGVGSLALAANKTELLIGELVAQNPINRKEGEKIVKKYQERGRQTRERLVKNKEELVALMSDKVEMSQEELRHFVDNIFEKPRASEKTMADKIDRLATQLSNRTKLTIRDSKALIEHLIDEFYKLQEDLKSASENVLNELQSNTEALKTNTQSIFDKIDTKTKEIRVQLDERTRAILDSVKYKLQSAPEEDVEHV